MFIPAQDLDHRDLLDALQGQLRFHAGTNSGYPRFLPACLRGRPVIPEPLAPPPRSAQRCLDLGTRPTRAATDANFRNLAGFTAWHSFPACLAAALGHARLRTAA